MSGDLTGKYAGAGRFRPWRRRRRLAYLEKKLGDFEGALAAQEGIFAALRDQLTRLEQDLRVARQLNSRFRRDIDQLNIELARAEANARGLRRAVDTQHAGLAELERAIDKALSASSLRRRS